LNPNDKLFVIEAIQKQTESIIIKERSKSRIHSAFDFGTPMEYQINVEK
jgi:hypothetical protein